ncbi:MAG TPA: long-chain fatty acid--CoA ligase [Terriglobales bacterium]|nr:long-chain fatty acid--CoA ligase [Terriglobales bacterium]
MAQLRTVNDVFLLATGRKRPEMVRYRSQGHWINISCREFHLRVASVAAVLREWGIQQGERIAILSENRPEWAIVDFACLARGMVDVPIYPTLTAEQAGFILRDSGARIGFVSTAEQFRKLQSIQPETALERIVVMDEIHGIGALAMSSLMNGTADLAEFEAKARAIDPNDLATIIYTSGTTGTPKGAMLTHGNLASNIQTSLGRFELTGDDRSISCLPLSHITARHVDYAMFFHGVSVAYCAIEELPQVFREIRPTFVAGVPRMYEKARQQAELKAGNGLKRKIFDWAIRTGRSQLNEIAAGRTPTSASWRLADKLVFSKIKAGFGGALLAPVSGGAPLGRDLAEWFASIGMRIYEGYGLTETSPVIAVNSPRAFKIGTVGKPLPNVECRIAEDGELLVRGPSVFEGYWHMPQETAAAIQPDGWFHTGDIGGIDEDGFLSITDRKKDLLKTSGGKFIAPQPIENALKTNPLIAYACVIGDRRKFPAVILAPNFAPLEEWAEAHQVAYSSHLELVQRPRVRALYQEIVDQLNATLAQFEKLKKILLVPDEFSIATGEITPTLKLRRRVVEQKYRAEIEELYASAVAPESLRVSG